MAPCLDHECHLKSAAAELLGSVGKAASISLLIGPSILTFVDVLAIAASSPRTLPYLDHVCHSKSYGVAAVFLAVGSVWRTAERPHVFSMIDLSILTADVNVALAIVASSPRIDPRQVGFHDAASSAHHVEGMHREHQIVRLEVGSPCQWARVEEIDV